MYGLTEDEIAMKKVIKRVRAERTKERKEKYEREVRNDEFCKETNPIK